MTTFLWSFENRSNERNFFFFWRVIFLKRVMQRRDRDRGGKTREMVGRRKSDRRMILNAWIEGKGSGMKKNRRWMMNNEPCFVSRDRGGYELRGSGAERHELKHFEVEEVETDRNSYLSLDFWVRLYLNRESPRFIEIKIPLISGR